MSLFRSETVKCPACGADHTADIFFSVNADRRADLRDATIDRSFQVETCARCGESFRIDPDLNYLDMGRGQWISVHPLLQLGRWEELLPVDQAAFDHSYGSGATEGGREIGEELTVRVVFGWAGFREKLVASDAGLDDVELELLKIALIRHQDDAPLSDAVELRLVDVVDGDLVLAWLDGAKDEVVETLIVPMSAYANVAGDTEGWAELRKELTATPFVDMQRLMI